MALRLVIRNRFSKLAAIASIITVAFVGSAMLRGSHAATSSLSIEPELGVISGQASTVADATASGGAALKFAGGAVANSCPNLSLGQCLPYDPASPWNTPIAANVVVNPNSATFMQRIATKGGVPLTSDPDQYTIPIYLYNSASPRQSVRMTGYFSSYDSGDSSRVGYGFAATIANVPIPSGVTAGVGSDGQITFWDPTTGTEYAFWQFSKDSAGNYTATNGWRYHTSNGYYGRFADGLSGRGSGMPYFAGLVRKWEVDQGHIDHALAFAYAGPSPDFVYPASKSDGGNFGGVRGIDAPEGTRIQLDPALTEADFSRWGLSPMAVILAKAMQKYGMYIVDNSGSSKIYLEDRRTAGWDASVTRSLVSPIPWTAFRVIAPPNAP